MSTQPHEMAVVPYQKIMRLVLLICEPVECEPASRDVNDKQKYMSVCNEVYLKMSFVSQIQCRDVFAIPKVGLMGSAFLQHFAIRI